MPVMDDVATCAACCMWLCTLAMALGTTAVLLDWTEQGSANNSESTLETDWTEAEFAEVAKVEDELADALRADMVEAEDVDNHNRGLDAAVGEHAANLWEDHELDRFLEEAAQWEIHNSEPWEWNPW